MSFTVVTEESNVYFEPGFVACDVALHAPSDRTFISGFVYANKQVTDSKVLILHNMTIIDKNIKCIKEKDTPIRCVTVNQKGYLICGTVAKTIHIYDLEYNEIFQINTEFVPMKLVVGKDDNIVYALDKTENKIVSFDIRSGSKLNTSANMDKDLYFLDYDSNLNNIMVSQPEMLRICNMDMNLLLTGEADLTCKLALMPGMFCSGLGYTFVVDKETNMILVFAQTGKEIGSAAQHSFTIKRLLDKPLSSMTFNATNRTLLLATKEELTVISTTLTFELDLEIERGYGLLSADLNGKSDPYCIISYGDQSFKTKVDKKTLNPKWHEKFKFQITDINTNVVVKCYDYDLTSKDDPLGQFIFPIRAAVDYHLGGENPTNQEKRETILLTPVGKEKAKGSISIVHNIKPAIYTKNVIEHDV